MIENNKYDRMFFDIRSANRFKRKVFGLFGKEGVKSLDELSELFPKIDRDYTKEDGKNFILGLCNSKRGWCYGSVLAYNHFMTFGALKENNIIIKKEKDYTNEGDQA